MSKKKIAWFISILFVPLLIPTYTYLVLLNIPAHFNMMLTQSGKWNIILLVFVVTAIMPILIITIVKRNKNLSKFLLLEERQERILPLIITCIFYYINYYILEKSGIHAVYQIFNIGIAMTLVITLIISFFWKISLHMIGIGGFTGVLIAANIILHSNVILIIILSILLAGIIATSRLILNSHRQSQLYVGYLMGVFCMLILYLIV